MANPYGKGRADFLELGSWNVVCYECGRKRKASMMKRHWQGYYVCPDHWEPRQPQDFVRGIQDIQTPPWTQPMPADQFIYVCTPEGLSACAGQAIAGCMVAGRPLPPGY
ncbi:MAG: hypothetical protein KGL39_41970 [Patescibacteria group bacterium]|nr:hypothetical protein [Patescibacteria group bacterium]